LLYRSFQTLWFWSPTRRISFNNDYSRLSTIRVLVNNKEDYFMVKLWKILCLLFFIFPLYLSFFNTDSIFYVISHLWNKAKINLIHLCSSHVRVLKICFWQCHWTIMLITGSPNHIGTLLTLNFNLDKCIIRLFFYSKL
jgi:hypothetical protein